MTNGGLVVVVGTPAGAVGMAAGTVGDVMMSGSLVTGGAVASGAVVDSAVTGGAVTTESAAGRLSYGFGGTSSVAYSSPVP